jgi:cob(I)alamin adenosyltransferase
MAMESGYLQVYTGNGKGKTTAAIGLAVRAVGAGMRVFIVQFAKAKGSSELAALARLAPLVEARQYGTGRFITDKPSDADVAAARQGLAAAREAIQSGAWDMIVLDEANIATWFGLFSVDELLALIDLAGGRMEVVVTGRKADPRVIERADLVTEMREIRHYQARGVPARTGIES